MKIDDILEMARKESEKKERNYFCLVYDNVELHKKKCKIL